MTELKPCPFCGGNDIRPSQDFDECVVCERCGSHIEEEMWDSRPIEDELRASRDVWKKKLVNMAASNVCLRAENEALHNEVSRLKNGYAVISLSEEVGRYAAKLEKAKEGLISIKGKNSKLSDCWLEVMEIARQTLKDIEEEK